MTTKRIRFVVLLTFLGALGVLVAVLRPQAEEVEENEAPAVSESDLQIYIKVYTAMQEDHDLVIDNAIKPYQISLDDFRQLERRVQGQSRLVDRVRQALLDSAKAHSVFAQAAAATPTPTPQSTPTEPKPQHKKK
ncbi:MAG: hypothetical protein ACHQ4J_14095 [Candidatus Binatia bacterium]